MPDRGNGVAGPRTCEAGGLRDTRGTLDAGAADGGNGPGAGHTSPRDSGASRRRRNRHADLPAFEATSGEQGSTLRLPPAAGSGSPSLAGRLESKARSVGSSGSGMDPQVSTAGNAGKAGNCVRVLEGGRRAVKRGLSLSLPPPEACALAGTKRGRLSGETAPWSACPGPYPRRRPRVNRRRRKRQQSARRRSRRALRSDRRRRHSSFCRRNPSQG